jgi:hypothetical protein
VAGEREGLPARAASSEGDVRATRRARGVVGQPHPWLIAEPEELGEALAWMLHTARGTAPSRVQDLARHLGISPAQVYNYISGTKVPPHEKWDKILEVFQITGPSRGEWATAGERVRERRRIRQMRDRAERQVSSANDADTSATEDSTATGDPEPALPPTPDPGAESSSARRWIITATAAVSLVAVVVTLTVLAQGHADLLSDPPDVECLRPGSATTWINHHSRRYLGATANRPEPAMTTATPGVSQPPMMTALSRGDAAGGVCATTVSNSAQSGTGGCLTADTDQTAVRWAQCNMSVEQLWIVENHWPDGGVMWKRIRPSSDVESCLQEQPQGNGSVSVTLRPCGTDWHQQWNVSGS